VVVEISQHGEFSQGLKTEVIDLEALQFGTRGAI